MPRYDIEEFLDDIETLLKAHLNNKITALNSEKSDSITLKTVSNSAYFLQSLDGPETNYDPYIFYGLENIETVTNMAANGHNLIVSVILCLADYEDVTISKRMFRYSRALEEVFLEHFTENEQGLKVEVHSVVPLSFKSLNSSYRTRAVGVALKTYLPS